MQIFMVSHMPDSAVTALVLSFRHNQNQKIFFMTDSYSFKLQALTLVYLSKCSQSQEFDFADVALVSVQLYKTKY